MNVFLPYDRLCVNIYLGAVVVLVAETTACQTGWVRGSAVGLETLSYSNEQKRRAIDRQAVLRSRMLYHVSILFPLPLSTGLRRRSHRCSTSRVQLEIGKNQRRNTLRFQRRSRDFSDMFEYMRCLIRKLRRYAHAVWHTRVCAYIRA